MSFTPFNNECGCAACHCPNRAMRVFGLTEEIVAEGYPDIITGSELAGILNGVDFSEKEIGWIGEVMDASDGTIIERTPADLPLKIYNHVFTTYHCGWDGDVCTHTADATRYKLGRGRFIPANDYYWKTVITRTGQHVSPSGHTFGIFSDPVQTKVHCTPNEPIDFDIPPVGETWIISDCADDYRYTKVDKDLELCLRICVGDSSTIWSDLCVTSFLTTDEEVAAAIEDGYGCYYTAPNTKNIWRCFRDLRIPSRGRNSIWNC